MILDEDSSTELKRERILLLKAIEGKHKLSSTGVVDNRILTGENNLYAILDSRNNLWYLKYKFGGLPEPLKQRFTNFTSLVQAVTQYYAKRNIQYVGVDD